MKFAYADPPYLGCGSRYKEHPDWRDCDTVEWHAKLIQRLQDEYPDGWALSMGSNNLRALLPFIPEKHRIAAWCKPFAIFKPNVNPAYTWEPVIFAGGRKGDRTRKTVKDHLAQCITLKKGLTGAKPQAFNAWICDLLGYIESDDTLDDLFPGLGGMNYYLNNDDIPLLKKEPS